MASLSFGQKAHRVLDFLLGLDHPEASGALMAHGFSEEDRLEGHRLLMNLASVAVTSEPLRNDLQLIEAVDAFENKWFPIMKACLARHHPELFQTFFQNLRQTTGPEVLLGVSELLNRIDGLEDSSGVFAPEGPAARQLLAERGLTPEVVEEVRQLLKTIGQLSEPTPLPVNADSRKQAEDALWSWYLEWSAVVRGSVKDRRALRRMGFLKKSRSGMGELDDPAEALDP